MPLVQHSSLPTFATLRAEGLDALIVTGANVANPRIEQEPFYRPLTEVIAWARDHVASVLCSCLSTHALMKFLYGIDRRRLPRKCWGVYSHRVVAPGHPLLAGINSRFDVPHSRYNEIRRADLEAAGLGTLIESAVARHLEQHPVVAWVNYAGLESSPYHRLAQKYARGRPSALLTFGIAGGFEAGVKFYDALKIFKRLVNIGDAKSLAAHPASTTHRQLTPAELAAAGVTPDMIRLCVGIEDLEDILGDVDQALAAAR